MTTEEQLLWEKGITGDHLPLALLNAVFYLNNIFAHSTVVRNTVNYTEQLPNTSSTEAWRKAYLNPLRPT